MKCSLACLAAAACLPWASVRALPASNPDAELFLVETAPGETKWVSEEGKWELLRLGQHFMDITNHRDLGSPKIARRAVVAYPQKCTHQNEVAPLAKLLDKSRMKSALTKFSSFHTRFHDSEYGRESGEWLLQTMVAMVKDAGARDTVIVKDFLHSWLQNSVMVTIPGRTNNTIIIGAHQDSLNAKLPPILRSPGADDDGSGTVTIMEVLRTLLTSKDIIAGKAENTIEFHWYSAEEAGLLGSQEIFEFYQQEKRDIKAMLQQDMTGYIQRTIENHKRESIGVITDFVDKNLTEFVKTAIEEYCDIPWVETKCGYACSDHAAASKAGFPSAFAIESAFEDTNPAIHSANDEIQHLSFDHMLQHARMTLGVVYELAFFDFSGQNERKSRDPDPQGRVNDAKGIAQCLDL